MTQIDPVFAAVTAPGTPFELAQVDGLLQFANAAPDLNLMIESARRHGDKTFLVDFSSNGEERRLTFEQVFAWRDQLTPMLGIQRGDRVAICMRNRAEWMVAYLWLWGADAGPDQAVPARGDRASGGRSG